MNFVKSGRRKDKGKVEREKKGDLAVFVGARGEEKEERETKRVRCHFSPYNAERRAFLLFGSSSWLASQTI